MDFSVITIGQVQNVLSAMQKNLECPICLDVVQEPVSTKCDHIFCRFCMFKLINKKKKGVVECPLCKTEVTKRSLKENSRFKQLIEGLLETIHAFELDTGVKFLKNHHFPKTSTEATAAESLCKESSVIQSKGFRNRRKSAEGNGQENFTLEASVNIQLTDAKMCRPRNKPQKSDSQKGIYIEFGSESSEEFFKQANKTGFEDKGAVQISSQVRLEELESAEKGNENSCNAQPDKLCAKEITLPDITGESDFSKECLSKKSTQSITERAKPDQGNVTGCQSCPLNVLAVDLLPEQCDRTGDASPTVHEDTSFFKNTEEMEEQQAQYNSENQEFDLEDSSESRLDKSKEMDTDVQSVEIVEGCEPENDSSPDKEHPLEEQPQPETLHSATQNKVTKKRLKQSIQKVNEWFSKSNEVLSSSSSLDESAASADVSGEGDLCLSDKESCVSAKTDPMADSMEIAAVKGKKRWSKQTAENIKDKIFGKTYKRGRKSNPPSTLRDILPTRQKEDVAPKCLNVFSKDRLKRKRKTACVLQPEDFIKKKDTEEADGAPQSVNGGLGDAEKKRCDESVAVHESHLSQDRANNALTEPEEGGESTWKKATEKVTTKICDGEPEMYNCDQKSSKKRSSAAKRCRHSSRTMCALQLVVDRGSVFPDAAEPQIDSYPSSGEPRKADSEQNPVRRSRRLQLLSEEMTKETRKGVKGARKNNSDHGRSVSGDQRHVAAPSAECKELCEPRDELSYRPVTNLEGGDLEANQMQVRLKNLSHTTETGKSLFSASCLPSNCGSTVPDTASQDSKILGSPLLLQLPSVSDGQTACHQTEEVTESPTAFPLECGRDSQNVSGDFKTEKLPMAKNVLELTKEAEDSDVDTQYLRNIFRHSKRSSFSLFQAPRQARAVEDPPPETLNLSCAAQVENKASKQLQPESLQEERTAAQNSSRVSEKEKLKPCAGVNPVPCFAVSTGEHRDDISQAAEEGTLTPARTGTAQTEHKNGLLQEEQGNEKPVSDEIGIESELRQNPIESDGSQSDQSNTEQHDSRQNDLNIGQENSFSSESNQAGKTEVVDCTGPILHFQSTSMICSATCQQSPAELSCEVTRTNSSKRERKHVKRNVEEAAQIVSTAAEALEEPLRENHDLTGLSETPNALLCSDSDIEENSSLCETDRKERSAVFVKSDNALGKELHKRSASSKPRSQGTRKSRRRVQKLPSSDEESCEDEDLPCFRTLIFSKSASTPLQTDKRMASVVECPVSPNVLPHSVSSDGNIVQKVPEAALSNVCASPSQESECSVNLFSSQSNMSEESLNGAQELNKHLPQAHLSKQMSSVNDSKETSQNSSGGLEETKDECQEDPDMGANLGEASGYDSEISIVEDSCEPFSQGEILTTQQKNAMQKSLKKLQQEMAALEAVLKQNGSQNCEVLPVHREPLPHSSTEGAFEMDQMRKENNRSPELLLSSSKSSLTKRSDLEKGPECDSVLKNKTPSEKTKPVQEAVQEHGQCQLGAENAEEQKSGTRQNSASVSSDLFGNESPDNSSSSARLFTPQTAEATAGPVLAQNTDKSCGPGHKLKRSGSFPAPVLHNGTGKENTTNPVVTKRKEMSIVVSGLNHSEHLVVQKFVKKTRSTLSNHITEGTTHVIMKTDEELVCERTLKYFLGIAGGKWVISYQWIIQSFKEGRILDEEKFEVRGDVINGRNHQGPKRARQALTGKIFKDFEICCCGPFTDMTTEHLEWMVELCGASVVKQPDLFTPTANSTAVVVVQPDAWKENMDHRAMQQQSNVAVVTREWVLDSVALYQCQELSAYLVS
ncbi:breast cancer type 1 susceptibility protein isoform X1 [Anomalospiza imberbis]|uniref:breast cancer type 1 susceptibility protein isoform X1 n=1 Tax=Anomalospiza imberbis TaxID=187417 RepID=UPI00358DF441